MTKVISRPLYLQNVAALRSNFLDIFSTSCLPLKTLCSLLITSISLPSSSDVMNRNHLAKEEKNELNFNDKLDRLKWKNFNANY